MKVVSVIKKGRGGAGASHAARYVSTRDRDAGIEGAETRKLFSASEDKLSFHQANLFLGGGRELNANDVLHVVISFEKEDDFNRLGIDEETRQSGVRDTARKTMKEIADLYKADELRWVAGIHRNTDNPHVHLLINRDYVGRETAQKNRLNAYPRELRLSWSNAPNGERVNNSGMLAQSFEKNLELNIARAQEVRDKNEKKLRGERTILGRAMLAEDLIERLKETRDAAMAYGEYRRYRIVDSHGQSRWISEHDLQLKAESKAERQMAKLTLEWTHEGRDQLRKEILAQELAAYKPVIKRIREMRFADLNWAESKYHRVAESSQPLINKATEIERNYQNAGLAVPIPILSRAELAGLQEGATQRGDFERLLELEKIRASLADEKGAPTRTNGEVGRLQAQLFIAKSALAVEQQALVNFEETKHIRRWRPDRGTREETTSAESSLAGIDKALAWESDQAKFIGARRLHWDDGKRELARKRAGELSDSREAVLEQMDEERSRIKSRLKSKTELVDALSGIFSSEETRFRKDGRNLPAPIFTEQELKQLAWHAERRNDPDFYRALITLESEHDAKIYRGAPIIPIERIGRAKARELMAGISLREAQLSLQKFNDRRDQISVIVKDDGGQNIKLARMVDVEPHTPLEKHFRPLIERSEKYRQVSAAVEDYGNRLLKRVEQTSASHAILKQSALEYEQDFVRQNPGMSVSRPQFTAREIGRLEQHAAKETDPVFREHYTKLYRESLTPGRDDSEMRTNYEIQKEYSRTIVLNERESEHIFDSFSAEYFATRNQRDVLAEHSDRRQEIVFER